MKQVGKYFEKDGSGSVRLTPEEAEDMWHIYNLLNEDDILEASTIRKVVTESATGSTDSTRVRTTLTIRVESIDFDTAGCVLRVKGRNIRENEYVKLGAYHTLDLEVNRTFKLIKSNWDVIHLERLQQACDPTLNAEVAAVVMQEGIAHVCLVTSVMTLVRAKIEMVIPRKRKGLCGQHDRGISRFFDAILRAIKQHVNFDVVKCVLLASPGFVKDQFFKYIMTTAAQQDCKQFLDNKGKFVLAHSSSGFKAALRDVLEDPTVQAKLADTKAANEVKALNQFFQVLHQEPDRALYGPKHVEKAADAQAIDTLLISDKLFRCQDVAERRRYVSLVEYVRDAGGDVKIFSSLHVSGENLDHLTGVAAILRFPMPEVANEEMDDDDSDSE
ncbi:protein pelota-like isoform X1 [Varroa jacobsoni]|uniref:Protein pelota homolog n=1 Tax=Varroa destructor TaxID=109461 RepID=A0A7M7KYV3_VARDE|nr:protein pelota-like [Varroa destructor]XP_022700629.1 protein pelota-like isoform X1 [Varroa jacobsoni]